MSEQRYSLEQIAEWTAHDGWPFLEGTRHNHVWRLARRARSEGYGYGEVQQYCQAHCVETGFDSTECEGHCKGGWQDKYKVKSTGKRSNSSRGGGGAHGEYWDKGQKMNTHEKMAKIQEYRKQQEVKDLETAQDETITWVNPDGEVSIHVMDEADEAAAEQAAEAAEARQQEPTTPPAQAQGTDIPPAHEKPQVSKPKASHTKPLPGLAIFQRPQQPAQARSQETEVETTAQAIDRLTAEYNHLDKVRLDNPADSTERYHAIQRMNAISNERRMHKRAAGRVRPSIPPEQQAPPSTERQAKQARLDTMTADWKAHQAKRDSLPRGSAEREKEQAAMLAIQPKASCLAAEIDYQTRAEALAMKATPPEAMPAAGDYPAQLAYWQGKEREARARLAKLANGTDEYKDVAAGLITIADTIAATRLAQAKKAIASGQGTEQDKAAVAEYEARYSEPGEWRYCQDGWVRKFPPGTTSNDPAEAIHHAGVAEVPEGVAVLTGAQQPEVAEGSPVQAAVDMFRGEVVATIIHPPGDDDDQVAEVGPGHEDDQATYQVAARQQEQTHQASDQARQGSIFNPGEIV